MADALSAPIWEHEFVIPDYNKFADLTAADPVGDLRQATGGKLSRSARYRTLNAVAGLEDELRAVLYAGGRAWGKLQLNRRSGAEPFTEADRAFLRAAAPVAGAALRRAMFAQPAPTDPGRGPGVLIVDEVGTVISATAEADAWLQELAPGPHERPTVGIDPQLLLTPLRTLTTAAALASAHPATHPQRHVAGGARVVPGRFRAGGGRARARRGLRNRLDRGRGLSPDHS